MDKVPEEIEELSNAFSGGYFNTRIIQHHIYGEYQNGSPYDETYFAIHEVYYNGKDEIIAWTDEPVKVQFDDLQDFKDVLEQIDDAMMKTVLLLDNNNGEDLAIVDTHKMIKEINNE